MITMNAENSTGQRAEALFFLLIPPVAEVVDTGIAKDDECASCLQLMAAAEQCHTFKPAVSVTGKVNNIFRFAVLAHRSEHLPYDVLSAIISQLVLK